MISTSLSCNKREQPAAQKDREIPWVTSPSFDACGRPKGESGPLLVLTRRRGLDPNEEVAGLVQSHS